MQIMHVIKGEKQIFVRDISRNDVQRDKILFLGWSKYCYSSKRACMVKKNTG